MDESVSRIYARAADETPIVNCAIISSCHRFGQKSNPHASFQSDDDGIATDQTG
ncbi:hypothetical protein [Bifidobacterium apri]|uniref:hypothetical protein n=1 Tax=Bifidobacterium apri TaxID=1769423 RepID=UPI00142EB7FC|nr:hypothetical protein [Bifidobacterium apri]